MEGFLTIRKTILDFYDRYDLYITPCLKFLLAFFSFMMINRMLSYFDALNHVFILVILALICAILPVTAIAVIGIALIILQCFAAGLVVGVTALCFFILLAVLLLRFVPQDMLWVILTPFAFTLGIPAFVPVSLGILRNRTSIAAGIGGLAVYCFLSDLPGIASQVSLGRVTPIEAVQEMIRSFIGHEELVLSAIVFTAVILIVNLIRRMLSKYTYLIAVLSGCAFYFILRLFGKQYLKTSGDLKKEFVGTLIAALLCLIISFFIRCADYKRTQVLQFEDDDYYYYVKAVPKRTPDAPDEYEEETFQELTEEENAEVSAEETYAEEAYPYEDEKKDPEYAEPENTEDDIDGIESDEFDTDISDFEDPYGGFRRYR